VCNHAWLHMHVSHPEGCVCAEMFSTEYDYMRNCRQWQVEPQLHRPERLVSGGGAPQSGRSIVVPRACKGLTRRMPRLCRCITGRVRAQCGMCCTDGEFLVFGGGIFIGSWSGVRTGERRTASRGWATLSTAHAIKGRSLFHQVENHASSFIITGQEAPETNKRMRDDLFKKTMSGDGISGRRPCGMFTKMFHLIGLKRRGLRFLAFSCCCYYNSKCESKPLNAHGEYHN
jgi:hypothetical protein